MHWENLKCIAEEIDAMSPILLSIEKTPHVSVEYGIERPGWLHWIVKSKNDTLYLFAVNDGDGQGSLDFIFPTDIEYVFDVTEDRIITPIDNFFQDNYDKLDVRIYKVR